MPRLRYWGKKRCGRNRGGIMADKLGLVQGGLRLVPHDPAWAACFQAERRLIGRAVADTPHQIAHIGSTAVPGLAAKPILDIAMAADDQDHPAIAAALVGLGYIDRGLRDGRLFIRLRGGDIRTHNLHLHDAKSDAWRDHVAFRDALRADPKLAVAYGALKEAIIRDFGDDRAGYAARKTAFVRDALRRD